MDDLRALQAVLGRGDFVGGIDNEALDFSQLEAFINSSDGAPGGSYFGETLSAPLAPPAVAEGKLISVVVEAKKTIGHPLPDSPPDSGSEHPYSPAGSCDQPPLVAGDAIYTTLGAGSSVYPKPGLLNPLLAESVILGLSPGRAEGQPELVLSPDGLHGHQQQPQQQASALGYGLDLVANLSAEGLEPMQAVYANLQNVPNKKRKLSQDLAHVKCEPANQGVAVTDICTSGQLSPQDGANQQQAQSVDEDYAASEACLSDSQYQCIRFQPFQQTQWHVLCDQNLAELPVPHYRVDADKGFNFSNADDAFVCQKKNHFQITCHVQLVGDAQFVKTPEGLQKICSFHLHFYGVKHDCPTQTIRVEQSQSDRSKKPFHPVLIELVSQQVTKVTVGRLHFSETTSNNMRKKGKPNPEQRYFQLVVGLHAHTAHGDFPICSHASQRIIVRASNPGQFESDVELCWQRGQSPDVVFHAGKVGVNTERPDEALVVHGNIKLTGHIVQPSDGRAKRNVVELDPAEQLRNVQRLRVVRYEYAAGFAERLNRGAGPDTGLIAQEVAGVIPEAVSAAGDLMLADGRAISDFLVVDKERIFMENVGAVKELCKVTTSLETRIDHLERISRRLACLRRGDSLSQVDSHKSNGTVASLKYTAQKFCRSQQKSGQKTSDGDEMCSSKVIQIVIFVLALIMAFCLVAMTTLYLMETARRGPYRQNFRPDSPKALRPNKAGHGLGKEGGTGASGAAGLGRAKGGDGASSQAPPQPPGPYRRTSTEGQQKALHAFGRPAYCTYLDPQLESSNLCPVSCCVPAAIIDSSEHETGLFEPNSTAKTHSSDRGKLIKIQTTNNIEKQRQKRDSDVLWPEQENIYDAIEPQDIPYIQIWGKTFNATLTQEYCSDCSNPYNSTYSVPISKYMSEDSISIVFRSLHTGIKDVEQCPVEQGRPKECPYASPGLWEENRAQKITESGPAGARTGPAAFEVEISGLLSRTVKYRAILVAGQNICGLSQSRAGIDFYEYNFNVYRDCDD